MCTVIIKKFLQGCGSISGAALSVDIWREERGDAGGSDNVLHVVNGMDGELRSFLQNGDY